MRSFKSPVRLLPILVTVSIGLMVNGSERASWDQEKAKAKVQEVLEIEAGGGLPWDDVDWMTDPESAARKAQEEEKPLFVFLYLKKDSGPPEAPC